MIVTITRATLAEQSLVANLLQLCLYDLCDCGDEPAWDVTAGGRFPYHRDLNQFWTDPTRHAFIARIDGNPAGFALVTEFSEPDRRTAFTEFFVIRKYRRQGVGEQFAAFIFDQFPGLWEVKQRERNVGATAFWRRMIGRITSGQYTEGMWSNERGHGPVQRFVHEIRVSEREEKEMVHGYAG